MVDILNWIPIDSNHDGHVSGLDIPFDPGSLAAKKAWMKIDAEAHSSANVAKAKALGHQKAVGMYMGKPLVPGEAGSGQGDYRLLVDKLVYNNGYSPEVAAKIAGKVAARARGV